MIEPTDRTGPAGGAFYDRVEVFQAYQEHRASGVHSPNWVMEEPALLRELGDVQGLDVIDLGCGDAALGRTLLADGCRSYLGVDGSARMIAQARQTLRDTTGTLVQADLEQFRAPAGSADLVVSRLALHYLEDVSALLRECHRMLVPGGRLVVTVVHPVLTAPEVVSRGRRTDWTVDAYFRGGARRREWMGDTVTWYHRTVQQYLTDFLAAGFVLTALDECEPVPDRFGDDEDELARRRRVPLFLLLAGNRSD